MKPTFQNIARLAGVGTATVERVLNGRGGVRPALVEKVVAAARALDYPKRLPERHRGILRIDVLLVRPETTFFDRLSQAFKRIGASLDATVVLQRVFLDELDPLSIARRIADPGTRRAGLIVAAPDHPAIRTALQAVGAAGIPIVQIVTRTGGIAADYVGIDNYAAGRSAALFLSRMQPRGGTVVVLCHSQIYQVQRDRVRGFSDYLAEYPRADLRFTAALFGQDEAVACADRLTTALRTWPDLVGLYNAGGANSALASVLRHHPRGRDVFFVGHELTERSAAALREGVMSVVLDQAPEAQARRSVDLMLHRLGLVTMEISASPIRFITVTAESL
ncbi:LacI family DNA-binding transcriptional regulator [Shinella daejeonensis]|uniref:LacI family DNA-binding transcriptional regulator n=1 Tax=Shinella daejeonensis TaxID=659017 RepID=UPI0020C81DA2|nr:LacI family DNA-binding transcriptional regulator [Shinella daejeonensis]MCP8896160.1 LacI family DNA-binding transcriptional regulator [Shinella daejeonensis]